MKLLVLIKSPTNSGGLETQNQLLVEGLEDRGHDVTVVKTQSPFGEAVVIGDDVDIVISQSAAGTRFLLSRKANQPPVVVIQHGTLWGSLKTRMRMEGFSLRLMLYAVKAYTLDQLRLRRCEAIIAVSEKVKRDLVREYFLPEDKIRVVYNGVEIGKLENGKLGNSEIGKLGTTVLYLGRLAKEKGLMTLLEAVSSFQFPVSSFQLLIVGDGPEFDHLNNRMEELGLSDTVELVGKVSYDDVAKYYQVADVFVLPSMANEGLPMTIIEAMAAGLPVVASRIGGIPEAVIDGETGLLVKPGSVGDLSAALSKFLMDDELRKKMGERARKIAKEKFSQEKMVSGVLECFELILE